MNHTNTRESNYQLFIDKYDPENTLSNKDKSALHTCYLIKGIVDKDIQVNVSYHSFIHGEEGDSEAALKQNRKGAIYVSFNEYGIMPSDIKHTPEQLYYDRSQLALISLGHTKLLKYINKMVGVKYPSDKLYDNDKEQDSRDKFHDKIIGLTYDKMINDKMVTVKHSCITKDNFAEFLTILLTDELIEEFNKIIDKDAKEMTQTETVKIDKLKIKLL